MQDQVFSISAQCGGSNQCIYQEGKDLFFDVAIKNLHAADIGFPLAFVQKAGPSIKLIDIRSGKSTHVGTALADWALKTQFTVIAPGQSVGFQYLITADELEELGGPEVDLTAEVTVFAGVKVGDEVADRMAVTTMHIVAPPKPTP